jgi:hypothetical protein
MCGRVCSLFYVYECCHYSLDLLGFFYLLGGHHHHHSNNMVVVAILSSYSYSSGNQLRVVEAIFPPMFSFALLFSRSLFGSTICSELKKRERQKAEMHKRPCDRWSIEYPFQIFSCVYVWPR